MFEKAEIEVTLQHVVTYSDDGRNIPAIPSLWLGDATRQANPWAHVAVTKSVRISTKKIEFVQGMHDGDAALCGLGPTVDCEPDHAVAVDDVRTKGVNNASNATARDRVPAC